MPGRVTAGMREAIFWRKIAPRGPTFTVFREDDRDGLQRHRRLVVARRGRSSIALALLDCIDKCEVEFEAKREACRIECNAVANAGMAGFFSLVLPSRVRRADLRRVRPASPARLF